MITQSTRKIWTSNDEDMLRENYYTKSPDQLVHLFNVSWRAIKCKAFKLRLNRQAVICDEEGIIADYHLELPMADIIKKYDISIHCYYKLLKKYNLEKNNHNLNDINIEEFKLDWNILPMSDLVKKYKVCRPTLRNKADELKLIRPIELIKRRSKLNIEQLKKDYIDNNMSTTMLSVKYCNNKNSGSHIRSILRGAGIKKSKKTIQQQKINTCIERYGSYPPNSQYGKVQKEIQEWLKARTNLEFKSDRTILNGKEIDLYNNSIKIGIEYCGLYWHNENSPEPRDHTYHYNKYKICKDNNIHLITIFEDEWINRQEQVKSVLLSILHKNSIKIHGRKCLVKTIDKKIGNDFYDLYHIQGASQMGLHYAGLYREAELVGVMSFGLHHRDTTKHTLDRLCFKYDISVAGGASKLFKFLIKESNVSSLISWSDNRWFNGYVYSKLGFKLDRELKPDYSYVKDNVTGRISKQSQKKNACNCPDNMTELQWANKRGLHRIWDCGKKCWLWHKDINIQGSTNV